MTASGEVGALREPAAEPPKPARPPIFYAEEVPWPERRLLASRVAKLAATCVGLAALLMSRIPLCPWAIATGTPCPGCGLTRATLEWCKGHFATAYHLHPLVFVATPAAAVTMGLAVWSYLKVGKARYSPAVMRWLLPPLKVLYVVMLAVWVVRFFGVFGGPVEVTQSIFAAAWHLGR